MEVTISNEQIIEAFSRIVGLKVMVTMHVDCCPGDDQFRYIAFKDCEGRSDYIKIDNYKNIMVAK